jgi:hypothetical protein
MQRTNVRSMPLGDLQSDANNCIALMSLGSLTIFIAIPIARCSSAWCDSSIESYVSDKLRLGFESDSTHDQAHDHLSTVMHS